MFMIFMWFWLKLYVFGWIYNCFLFFKKKVYKKIYIKILFFRFGLGVIGKRIGILFNDEMDDFFFFNIINVFGIFFFLVNFIKFGKRLMFFMCFVVLVDKTKRVKLVVGVVGGFRITLVIVYVRV